MHGTIEIPKRFYLILLLASLLPLTLHQVTQCPMSIVNPIQLNNQSVLCAIVTLDSSINATVSTRVYPFTIPVDKSVALSITGLAKIFTSYQSATIQLQFQNTVTFQSMIVFNSTENIYRTLFSAVISIKNGVFQSIIVENEPCSSSSCLNSAQVCLLRDNRNECFLKGTSPPTDPSIFVSWIGTDLNGEHMVSHASRLSRLEPYSLQNIYDLAKSLIAV